ncbi:hypothetical protein [Agrobacterium tumefaciens]|uniref:Uncharacterized protein n=1 Tax=Agrobacterium tumefaciens TaxID=358 RepID=A0AAW8LVT0_AGRTU|nr:hypothetical protein [Agrobacterium tumefaciens]MDR6702995.1 hypothetical protein [Agrobacterium tumefaciens]
MTYSTAPFIRKSPLEMWEKSSFIYDGNLYRVEFRRQWTEFVGISIIIEKYLDVMDAWQRMAEIPFSGCLGCAFSEGGRIFLFAVTTPVAGSNKIMRWEIDPATWTIPAPPQFVRQSSGGYQFFNTSVCAGPHGYILVYETNEASPFSFRFLQSSDLEAWQPIGDLCNRDFYSACPTISYAENGWYMVTYLFCVGGKYVTAMARTNDFVRIQSFGGNAHLTAFQQLLAPDAQGEGINTSDVDFIEWNGKVKFNYLIGDQSTWGISNEAEYDGTLINLYHEFWPGP